MMTSTRFKPDTCDCIVEYSNIEKDNDDPKFIKVHQKCKMHAHLDGDTLYKAVLAHNRGFNLKYGTEPTEAQVEEIDNDKRTERNRIKNLPEVAEP